MATCGSEAEAGKAKVVDVEVDIVGGAAIPVFKAVGEVPVAPVPIGARFGDTLEGPAVAPPSILFTLPTESRAECLCRGLYGSPCSSALLYESDLTWAAAKEGEALSPLPSPPAGRWIEELEAPRSGCVRVSLGWRGARVARPSESDENKPFCLSSAMSSWVYEGSDADSWSNARSGDTDNPGTRIYLFQRLFYIGSYFAQA